MIKLLVERMTYCVKNDGISVLSIRKNMLQLYIQTVIKLFVNMMTYFVTMNGISVHEIKEIKIK